MSGGNDSTLVTRFANLENKSIRSFNIGFEDKDFDESKIAKKLAVYLKQIVQKLFSKVLLAL